jgi:regulator of sirC expression with transglutaminase-like and TPR domain
VETATLDPARREALLGLLDDTSAAVRQALISYFTGCGASAAPFLRSIAHGPNRVLAQHAAWYLEEIKFSDPVAEFHGFIRSLNYEIETGALLLARTVSPELDIGRYCSALDAMAVRCRELLVEPATRREKCRLLNRVLFYEWGFRGNPEHPTDPRSTLLDQVLVRRKGSPLALGIVYLLVAGRLGLELELVGLPGACVVGSFDPAESFFIDPFDQGLLLDSHEVFTLLRSKQSVPRAVDLAPMPVREVLGRCCQSLLSHYTAVGDTDRAKLFGGFIEEFEAAYTRHAL